MTTAQVLDRLRRLINDRDPSTALYDDEDLLQALGDARDELEARRLLGFEDLVVVSQEGAVGFGITPEPTLEQGLLLVKLAAVFILNQIYHDRLSRGEIGMTWASGPESESTINADRSYQLMLRTMNQDVESAILIYRSQQAGFRVQ